jgi:hypothetical protein
MQQLLQMTHAQWAYRNATVHLEVKDGQTAAAHKTILKTVEGFLHTNPEQLLEEHRHLLFSDFAALASGPTKDKLEWISEIDSALGAASHMARGSRHAVQTRYCRGHQPWAQTEYKLILFDAEGSMRWQRHHKWSRLHQCIPLATTFPLFRMERTECPLLKAQAFALLWWIRTSNMSAVCCTRPLGQPQGDTRG